MDSTKALPQIQQSPFELAEYLYESAQPILQEEPERVLDLCREALGLLKTNTQEERRLIADLHQLMASASLLRSDYIGTIEHAFSALERYRELGETFSQMRSLFDSAYAYQELGDYVSALEKLLTGQALAEFHQDPPSIANAFNRIGVIHSLRGDHREALAHFEKCLAIYRDLDDQGGMARMFNNCCIEQRQLGDLEQALASGFESLRLFRAAENPFGEARINGNLTRVYIEIGQLDEAMAHAQAALQLATTGGRREAMLIAHLQVGRVHNRMGKPEAALPCLQIALTLANEISNKRQQAECHLELCQSYKQQGTFEQALFHFEQHHALREAVFNDENERKFRDLEVLNRTRQARKEAEFYQMRHAELQRQREQDRRYFESLNEMKDEFISAASHDLKNPLTGMQLTLDMLEKHGQLDDEIGQRQLKKLGESIQKMRHLVVSLLDLAKLETGRALEMERVTFYDFLKTAINDHLPQAQEKQLALALEMRECTLEIELDPLRMRQAIDNLLSNAIKYTPAGGEVVMRVQSDGERIAIEVQDTGLGIPDEDLPKIFERFYRVQNPAHAAIEGTGLGLSITRSIIEQHQGTIEVESQPGSGSSFRISLPIATSDEAANP